MSYTHTISSDLCYLFDVFIIRFIKNMSNKYFCKTFSIFGILFKK